MSSKQTFYWHDYETFGTDPRRDWPSQFAGIRTDEDLNVIGESLMIYCKPPNDCLPQPEACLVTGISPQKAFAEGYKERDFIGKILNEMTVPNTCVVGYNSIRFDDEVTRNSLYRNFHDPYQREYLNGNSRWDLIDLVRMCHALRPEGIEWPKNEDGVTSFRLELLTEANGIGHEAAHDALSDVIATIEFAKLIKNKQERLFKFLFDLRKKDKAFELLRPHANEAIVHVSGKYPAKQNCINLVLPICEDPTNKNGIVVCDLDQDPSMLMDLSADEIRADLYTKSEDMAKGKVRPPIKTIHANKCPAIAPTSVLGDKDIDRLELDIKTIEEHKDFLLANKQAVSAKLREVLSHNDFEQPSDPDLMIYSGGFFSRNDKQTMQNLTQLDGDALAKAQQNLNFEDQRLSEMLFRYRARNFPESLAQEEQAQWQAFRESKFAGNEPSSSLSLEEFDARLKQLSEEHQDKPQKLDLIEELKNYRLALLNH